MSYELSENRSASGLRVLREPARHGAEHPATRPVSRSPMFEDRSYKRTFYSAPQSVTSLVAAFLEPAVTVLTYLGVNAWFQEPVVRSDLTLCLLIFALTFPGRNRFKEPLLNAAVDITSSWVVLLSILALCGYATRSFGLFNGDVLLAWAVGTPILQWGAVGIGQRIVQRADARPEARRSAVVVGAGPLGVKVARALAEAEEQGIDFVGFFDDRSDERVHDDAVPQRLGGLKEVAGYVRARGIKEVFITLPLGSQPRIVDADHRVLRPVRIKSADEGDVLRRAHPALS